MAYFFFSGSSRGGAEGVTVVLTEPLKIDVTLATPIITVGTVLKLPAISIDVELVMPEIEIGTELDLSPLDVEVTLVMPHISLGADAESWWYYNMIDGD
jgi:hypothetical protein